jgi:adenine/guanine phosphoribosyltransferase-like PRPP-binding protein
MTCECTQDGFCNKLGRPMVGILRKICAGEACNATDEQRHRVESWLASRTQADARPRGRRASATMHTERVGAAMSSRIEGFIKIGGEGCESCRKLAAQMDQWGIAGCERNRSKITAALVKNRSILEAALIANGETWKAKAVHFAPESVLYAGANWLLDLAIDDVRNRPKKEDLPRTPRRPKGPRRVAAPRQGRGGVFGFNPASPSRFITSAQLQHDVKTLLSKIPSDITAIAGVARSGLSVATMLSMYLHLPMLTIRQTMNDVVDTGNGWRLGGNRHIDPKKEKVLIVDDTVMTGNSIKAITPLVSREFRDYMFAAVYVNPKATRKPHIHAVDLPWPHILEWNVFNSVLSSSTAMDFDGILCHDCPAGSDDDGEKYLHFIRNAQPLYVPRKVPVPLVVTARTEKYRQPTLEWLARHRINVVQLIMHPAKTLKERQRDDIAAFKARHFDAWLRAYSARVRPQIFFESEDWQARRIGQLVGGERLVICPHTAGVY